MKAECPTCQKYIKILSQKEEREILSPKKQIRKTTKLNIAFDLDCCLVDFMGGFENLINKHGFKLIRNNSYDIKTDPAMTKAFKYKMFDTLYTEHHRTPFYPGAKELLWKLHVKSQQPVMIVTSRKIKYADVTHRMIAENIDIPYILCFANKFSKIIYLTDIDFFVEDRRLTAKQLASAGKWVFKPKQFWNKMPEHSKIKEISGVHELIQMVNEFIKKE